MNRILQVCFIFSMLLLLGSQAGAQITISDTDIQSQFAADSTKRYFDTTATTLVTIGDTGATTWDFTQLKRDSSWSILYVQPATTPYTADFPAANLAQKSNLTLNISGFGVSAVGTAYEYYKLDTYLVDYGIKGSGTVGGLISGNVDWTKLPGDTLYPLPLTYGTRWGSSDSAITRIFVQGFYDSRTAKYETWDNVVDAYGPMTLPDSTVHQALRIRKTPRPGGYATVSYSYVARDGAFVNLTSVDVGAALTGMINVKNITWGPAVFTPPTAITSTPTVPAEFSLAQNYPNPFNPSTVIRYGLPQQSHVALDVFNVIGQKVATLVNENQQAGYHEVNFNGTGLPSGIYFYRLTAGGFIRTLKMVLTK